MTKLIYTNLRNRLLCALEAAEVVMMANGVESVSDDVSQNEVVEALNRAPYSSVVQRKLQAAHLHIEPTAAENSDSVVMGVVVEFGVEAGIDALAAYSDGVVAWFDASSGKFTEVALAHEGEQMCQALMIASQRIKEVTGSPSFDAPPPPPPGFICISLIGERGISFGLGSSRDLASDGYGGPVIHWALKLRNLILSANKASQDISH